MNLPATFAHAVLIVLGTFARWMLSIVDIVEGALRALMRDAGLSGDVQTVLLVFVLAMFLLGVLRLLHGRIRGSLAVLLTLILAHTLERIALGTPG